jgi:hypothetical protein
VETNEKEQKLPPPMKPKPILCLALVLSGGFFGCCNIVFAQGQVYQNTNYGFQLVVPEGWTATETNFTVFHYNDVFLTVNNERPDLTIQKQRMAPGKGVEFNPKVILQQMQPGEVYVSVGYFDGPGGPTMRLDSVDNDLHSLLVTNEISVSGGDKDLSVLDLRFFKRGHWWNISAYMKNPVTAENRQQVISMLKSFGFVAAPVGSVSWAESLAWKELPENVRSSPRWPVVDYVGQRPQYGLRSLLVKKSDSGYLVTFDVDGAGIWGYLVSENGRVVQAKP